MSVRNGFLVTAAIGFLCVGCATEHPTEITRARTLIEQAEKAGAQRYAAAELTQARDKLKQADDLANNGKADAARARANEAAADAELATQRASAGDAQRAANEVAKGTESLQRETDRNGAAAPPAPVVAPNP